MSPSPRTLALARAGVFGVGALLASTIAHAQSRAAIRNGAAPAADGTPGSLLSLTDALRAALEFSPTLRKARQQVRAGHGAVAVAESPLDPVVQTAIASTRQSDLQFGASVPGAATGGAPLQSPTVINSQERVLDYQVGFSRQFANGIALAPSLDIQQATASSLGFPSNRAIAGLNLTVPLARNRTGGAVAANRRAAIAAYDATRADLHQAAAQTVLDAAVAYWDYAAAGERLNAYRASEERARVLVNETVELVRADARPAADVRQFRGNLAGKRAQRIAAEQVVAEARQHLGVVLGLSAGQIASLPPARLDAPRSAVAAVAAAADRRDDRDAGAEPRIAQWARSIASAALARRSDVRAAAARREAAIDAAAAADQDLRPRVDLTVGVSYSALTQGGGIGGLVSPLGRTMPGASSVIQLQYELPTKRLAARGRAEQAAAALAQARLGESDIVRQIESSVATAAAGVERGRDALAAASEAVTLAREVVDDEKQKFRLGVSTQIDVIYAEDGLVNALLADITARRTYTGAVGALRFAAGDLGGAAAGAGDVAPAATAYAANALAAVLGRDPHPGGAAALPGPTSPAATPRSAP